MANVSGQEYGPYAWDQMLQMAAEGRVPADLPVRRVSDSQWTPAAQVPGLLSKSTTASPAPGPSPSPPKAAPPRTQAPTLKKAKPPVPPSPAPPSAGVAVPSGIPVGAPVGVPVGTTARFAPAPASGTGAPAFNFSTTPAFGTATVKPAKKVESDDDDDVPVRKKSSPLLLVGILGGSCALVAAVGLIIVAVVWSGKQPGDENAVAATQTSAAVPSEEADPAGVTVEEEANPGTAVTKSAPEKNAGEPKKSGEKKGDAKSERGKTVAQQATIKGVSKWADVATIKGIGVGNAKVAISRIWLSADDKGARAQGTSVEAPPAAKYLFVELIITNKAGSPLKYRGWNLTAEGGGAVLAQADDRFLSLVPATQTPGVPRLTSASIPGAGSITETLVFEAPQGEFDDLKLALPHVAFYPTNKGKAMGLVITPDVLANEGGQPTIPAQPGTEAVAETPIGGEPAATGTPAEGETPAVEPPPMKPVPGKAPAAEPPPKKPSLLEEIDKFAEEEEKRTGKKMDQGQGKPAEPAKAPPQKPAGKKK